MRVCVIDGRGGGLGKRLVEELRLRMGDRHDIIALGTNQAATDAMQKAGATASGTGERRIQQTLPTADCILASLNLILPGAMFGEVTPAIAGAILSAPGRKLLLPVNRAQVEIVGAEAFTLEHLIRHTVQRVQVLLSSPL